MDWAGKPLEIEESSPLLFHTHSVVEETRGIWPWDSTALWTLGYVLGVGQYLAPSPSFAPEQLDPEHTQLVKGEVPTAPVSSSAWLLCPAPFPRVTSLLAQPVSLQGMAERDKTGRNCVPAVREHGGSGLVSSWVEEPEPHPAQRSQTCRQQSSARLHPVLSPTSSAVVWNPSTGP